MKNINALYATHCVKHYATVYTVVTLSMRKIIRGFDSFRYTFLDRAEQSAKIVNEKHGISHRIFRISSVIDFWKYPGFAEHTRPTVLNWLNPRS